MPRHDGKNIKRYPCGCGYPTTIFSSFVYFLYSFFSCRCNVVQIDKWNTNIRTSDDVISGNEHTKMVFLALVAFFSIHKWVDMNGNVASRSCTTFELCMPSVYQNRMLRFHCILIAFKSLHRQFVSSDKSVNVHLNIFLFIQYITIYHDITQLQTRCKVIGQHFHPRPKFNKSFIGEHAPHFMHTSV